MKIVLISMVRNEADVIELFCRYYAEFVDELLIIDHHSLDATREILPELVAEGLPIRLLYSEDATFDQAKHLTNLMKRASAEHDADWVLPLDADEFLISLTGGSLRSSIESLSADAPTRITWRTYVPTPDDPKSEPHLLQRMTYHRHADTEEHKKVLVPGRLAGDPKMSLVHGSHRVLRKSWLKKRTIQSVDCRDLALAHFPLRSLEQAIAKGLVSWPSRLADSATLPRKHWSQQRIFDEILRGDASSDAWLTKFALTYAQNNVPQDRPGVLEKLVQDQIHEPVPIELRWPNPRTITPLEVVSEMAERLGKELGELRRSQTKLTDRR